MNKNEIVQSEFTEQEVYMIAVETAISTLFEQADDDSRYHHRVDSCFISTNISYNCKNNKEKMWTSLFMKNIRQFQKK